jgi:hypothetical protein
MPKDFVSVLDDCRARLEACLETLDGLAVSGHFFSASDAEAVRQVCDPTLAECYAALADMERMRDGARNSLRITGYVATGNLEGAAMPETLNDLYRRVGELLDANSSSEILGDIVFIAENQKYYRLVTEAVIEELSSADVEQYVMQVGSTCGTSSPDAACSGD